MTPCTTILEFLSVPRLLSPFFTSLLPVPSLKAKFVRDGGVNVAWRTVVTRSYGSEYKHSFVLNTCIALTRACSELLTRIYRD